MKYMGSKARHGQEILEVIFNTVNKNDYRWWIEPFVGGGNMIDKVDGLYRYGCDSNYWAIDALLSIKSQLDSLPKNNREFTEDDYKKLRGDDSYRHKGYAGFAFSYGGKWLGGWSRTDATAVKQRDYVAESYRNAIKQSPKIQSVLFGVLNYDEIDIPKNSIIYCDPPYAGTTKYKDHFDHDKFWDWCDQQVSKGQKVFVSEYKAPEGWRCIWRKEVNNSLTKETGGKKGIEKLFTK